MGFLTLEEHVVIINFQQFDIITVEKDIRDAPMQNVEAKGSRSPSIVVNYSAYIWLSTIAARRAWRRTYRVVQKFRRPRWGDLFGSF
jgi:hypothetical protein